MRLSFHAELLERAATFEAELASAALRWRRERRERWDAVRARVAELGFDRVGDAIAIVLRGAWRQDEDWRADVAGKVAHVREMGRRLGHALEAALGVLLAAGTGATLAAELAAARARLVARLDSWSDKVEEDLAPIGPRCFPDIALLLARVAEVSPAEGAVVARVRRR